jgi:hypothetical protein
VLGTPKRAYYLCGVGVVRVRLGKLTIHGAFAVLVCARCASLSSARARNLGGEFKTFGYLGTRGD